MKLRYLLSSAAVALIFNGAAANAQTAPGSDASVNPAPSPTSASPAAETPAPASRGNEIVVTALKREQALQDVPLAVSAFNEDSLKSQGVDGARNLVLAVPNVTFQRRSLRNNFQIRGVGSQLTTTGGDDGVGVHLNGAPLTENRMADADFYDVQRVEVLRGPQGTLYGRNATGGVVNVITNKPNDSWGGALTAEFGNFTSGRFQGYVNAPIMEGVNLRLAGFGLIRGGYATNLLTNRDVDGRQILSGRATLGFEPSSNIRSTLMWEVFNENDDRGSFLKQLCKKDPGLASVLGVATGAAQAAFTQGCLPASVYDDDVYGAYNSLSSFSGIVARQIGLITVDAFKDKVISRDLREVELFRAPQYRAHTDNVQFNTEWDVTNSLTATALVAYNENHTSSRYDTTGGLPTVAFPASAVAPGGFLNDPQMGLSDRFRGENGGRNDNHQWSAEVRLQSDFDGPINFNVGGLYLNYNAEAVTYVATNAATRAAPIINPAAYIDPLAIPDYTGHNYYISRSQYELKSKALMGEVYIDPVRDIRVTVGLRYTDDDKWTQGSGSTLFVAGRGPIYSAPQTARFKEVTGRFNVDWSPELSFTDKTLIYASYSKGYKGGGFNPPGVIALGLPATYDPEFINAYEVGTKNTFANGRLTLNLTGFYYDYKGYQIGRSVNRCVFNENIDATIKGLEIEFIAEPVRGLRINSNLGLLDTEIKEGASVDTFYRTMEDPAYIYANAVSGGCVLNAQGVATMLNTPAGKPLLANFACSGPATLTSRMVGAGVPLATAQALAAGVYNYGPNVSLYTSGAGEGVLQNLVGNELPNAPKMTFSFGAEYKFAVAADWDMTVRGDYYRQSSSFQRYNNQWFDKVRAWENVNASLILDNHAIDMTVQFFMKNLLNKDTMVGFAIADENLGAVRTPYLQEPRLYGVSVTKRF